MEIIRTPDEVDWQTSRVEGWACFLHFNFLLLYGQVLHATGTSRTIPLYSTTSTSGNKKCRFPPCALVFQGGMSQNQGGPTSAGIYQSSAPLGTLPLKLWNHIWRILNTSINLLPHNMRFSFASFSGSRGSSVRSRALLTFHANKNLLMHLETRLWLP